MNILIRGGGDIATGVALRLHRTGYHVFITELNLPLAVRRTVSFAETVYEGAWTVEEVTARRAESTTQALEFSMNGLIPVLIAPELEAVTLHYGVLVDARLAKAIVDYSISPQLLIIGLGPGFIAGKNCHAVVETNRGHTLGRVYWNGSAQPDTATPEGDPRRVLRAPTDGMVVGHVKIGQHVEADQIVASVGGEKVASPFKGIVRGLIHPGLSVSKGLKIGDIDSRDDPALCRLVSDKALAVGGGVLEAILGYRK
jgi:xanthine dehydrogenase accessory factor